jgi:hypothetical protein
VLLNITPFVEQGGRLLKKGKSDMVSGCDFVKMAGFHVMHRTLSLLLRSKEVRYSGSFLSVFTKFERLRRHNFAHCTSLLLEKELSDMGYWIVDGRQMTDEEHDEWKKQKELQKQKIEEEAARLSREVGEAYAALKAHLERHPEVSQEITDERELDQQIYYNLLQNLERANEAPRCEWIREDGTVCKSPRIKNDIHCYAHYQMRKARAEKLLLPALTDANAIQVAVMLVQKALIDGEISEKMAGLLLYSIQIAAANVSKTTFGQADDEDMVTEIPREHEVMNAHRERREKKNLPLMHTENADLKVEELGLPRIDADERGSEVKNLQLMKQTSPRMNTDQTDQDGELGKMLPESAGLLEGFAGLDRSTPGCAAPSR